MFAVIDLEWIGHDQPIREVRGLRRPWVAELTPEGRRFLRPHHTDYRDANSVGSRGVYLLFHLESGRVYEIKHYTSWRSFSRRTVRVTDDGDIVPVPANEVDRWL